jgi:hypothetical protein
MRPIYELAAEICTRSGHINAANRLVGRRHPVLRSLAQLEVRHGERPLELLQGARDYRCAASITARFTKVEFALLDSMMARWRGELMRQATRKCVFV